MHNSIEIHEKYERNGWPSMPRPDLQPPANLSLQMLTAIRRVRNHQLSPNGEHIAFIWDGDDLSDIYVMPARGGWPRRISTDRGPTLFWNDEIPQWSPDSQWIAYTSHGDVYLAPLAGGLPRKLLEHIPSTWGPRWMPDSRQLVISLERHNADQLALTDLSGATLRLLTDRGEGDHWDARPSPDGESIAFVYRPFNDLRRTDICLLHLASGAITTLYGQPGVRAWAPRWSPDGKTLAFLCQKDGHDDLWTVCPADPKPKRLTHLGHDLLDPTWAPDGKSLAAILNRAGSFELVGIHAKTGQAEALSDTPGQHSNPQWSPGGAYITFEFESPLQPPDLYHIHTITREKTRLTESTPPALASAQTILPESVLYKSLDGLDIPAFLYRPLRANRAAIVLVHGGPSSQYNLAWDELAQYLTAKGYTILCPNYRGSTGYGVAFERANYGDWGNMDMHDCLAAADYLKTFASLDPARIAIMGGSYGGYMTNCCLARDPEYRFACGISKYGDADVVNSWALCSRELRYYAEIFLGHPAKFRAEYIAASPIHQAANVQKPILVLHGLKDNIVPPESSEQWVEALRQHGKTFEYKTYTHDPHGWVHRSTALDAYRRIEQFLDWHLLP